MYLRCTVLALTVAATLAPAAILMAQGPQPMQTAPLIPRQVLFGNPERAAARLSHDGRYISYIAPVDGVMNVWVAAVDRIEQARPVTKDRERGIRSYYWAYDNRHILYTQDTKGDENWHVYATDITDDSTRDLTPLPKIAAQVVSLNEKYPHQILVGINDRDERLHDLYRVDLKTGERTLLQQNPGFVAFLTDHDDRVRFAVTFSPDGGQLLLEPDAEQGWKPRIQVSNEDAMTTGPVGFDKSNQILYLTDSRERNTSALVALDLQSGEQQLIAEDARADLSDLMVHPTEKTIQAVAFTYERQHWRVLDDAIAGDLDYLRSVENGEMQVTDRTLDDQLWTVAYSLDNGPAKYYLYDRRARQAKYLFSNRSDLDQYPLVNMHAKIIPARDGLQLVSYLSLPPGSDPDGDAVPDRPLPMVLLVHGGPWARDEWGFDPLHQWLANRGYAVLSVNFRGSTGFGKSFINAANGQWSKSMHDDLLDAVQWAAETGVADRRQVAIMGGSYGGYATLVGLAFTPEVFACGVDIVGPSNLVTLLENVPPYWIPMMPLMTVRVGDASTDEGRQALLDKSPLTRVDRIQRPLLIGQGANDPRVTQQESDQIVRAMQDKGIPVTYVLYPDEGHGFARPENRLSFFAITEAFLSKHLGGRFQPLGEDLKDSSLEIVEGRDGVPGLPE